MFSEERNPTPEDVVTDVPVCGTVYWLRRITHRPWGGSPQLRAKIRTRPPSVTTGTIFSCAQWQYEHCIPLSNDCCHIPMHRVIDEIIVIVLKSWYTFFSAWTQMWLRHDCLHWCEGIEVCGLLLLMMTWPLERIYWFYWVLWGIAGLIINDSFSGTLIWALFIRLHSSGIKYLASNYSDLSCDVLGILVFCEISNKHLHSVTVLWCKSDFSWN